MNKPSSFPWPEHMMVPEDFAAIAQKRVNNCDALIRPKGKILWLMGSGENAKRQQHIRSRVQEIDPYLNKLIKFVHLNSKVLPLVKLKAGTKGKLVPVDNYREILANQLASLLPSATMIVINDFAVLSCLLESTTGVGHKKTLDSFRGSVYINDLFGGIPALVVNDAKWCYMSAFESSNKSQSVQFLDYDIIKLKELWFEPSLCLSNFDDTFEIVNCSYKSETGGHRLAQDNPKGQPYFNSFRYREWLTKQTIIALDYETTMGHVSCLSVSGMDKYNNIKTWLIPLINTQKSDNLHMSPISFWGLVDDTLSANVPKIWHNGAAYDNIYTLDHSFKSRGIQHDTLLMWHSYRAQMPLSLATVASVFNYDYYYWKDEISGGSGEKQTQVKYSVPVSREGLLTYWRYAGLDTYHTLKAFIPLAKLLDENNWAMYNYAKEYALSYGPMLETNFRGAKLDRKKLNQILSELKSEQAIAKTNLETASNGIICDTTVANKPAFGTNAQKVNWIYNTLHAEAPPKKRGAKTNTPSVDQKQLILVSEQHPIFDKAINLMEAYAKPTTLINNYSNMKFPHDRFFYSYGLRTYTGRYSCTSGAKWCGGNAQVFNKRMKPMIVADEGKVLIDIDYSQADLYHFAIACGDPNMLETVFDNRDTHAVHVEMILQVPYEEVMRKKNSLDEKENAFINHPIKGVRQIIKKLSHGGNYGMTPPTAYVNAGRESLEAAAGYLGKPIAKWTRSHYYDFCEELLVPYFAKYSRQKTWRKEIVQACVDREGLATCFGGLTVYFDEWKRRSEHKNLMRALLAFYGQGGTAGMINQASLDMFYKKDFDYERDNSGNIQLDKITPTTDQGVPHHDSSTAHLDKYPSEKSSFLRANGLEILFQTHDSLTFQAPIRVLTERKIVNKLLTMMELQCNFNNMSYKVPCEVNIGYRWSKNMPEVKPNATDTDTTLALLENFILEGVI